MKSKARMGLDALLERYPTTEPAEVYSQASWVVEPLNAALGRMPRDSGWWTVADLVVPIEDLTDSGAAGGDLLRFAIWNETGSVYRVDKHGAAEDDPFIEVMPLRLTSTDKTYRCPTHGLLDDVFNQATVDPNRPDVLLCRACYGELEVA